ncbi:MAG: hypothetical protein EPN82_05240 [Bacteroidetes bacterium]|nr:MAG: hypothetical protein EPN82_05240 [Bacteroidota bacterium]
MINKFNIEKLIFLLTAIFVINLTVNKSFANDNSDSVNLNKDTSKVHLFEMKRSPLLAVGMSLILPGSGQVYVGSYWKAPLFLGGAVALGYSIYHFNRRFQDTYVQYDLVKQNEPDNAFKIDSLRRYREYYRDNRDMSAFYLLGVYILAAVDAYVGAHLYDFTVSDEFTFIITPDIRYAPGVNLIIRW